MMQIAGSPGATAQLMSEALAHGVGVKFRMLPGLPNQLQLRVTRGKEVVTWSDRVANNAQLPRVMETLAEAALGLFFQVPVVAPRPILERPIRDRRSPERRASAH